MEIILYQINPDRDYEEWEFKDYAYAEAHGIEPFAYDQVFAGTLDAENLSEVYMLLNGEDFPDDYRGRAMSQSDVCQVIDENGKSRFYYVDRYSFKEIEFDASLTRGAKERTMTVVACYPGKKAQVIEIPNNLKGMQDFVGGFIEATYPSSDPIAIVMNEEGKINGLPLNRALYTEEGEMYDIVAGPMFVCGLGEDDFASLQGGLLQKYLKKYEMPEQFVQIGNQILAIKVPEHQQKEDHTQKHHKHR